MCTGKADCTRDNMGQPNTVNAINSLRGRYCGILDAIKLINQPFDGDKRKLKKFVDSVTTNFELNEIIYC